MICPPEDDLDGPWTDARRASWSVHGLRFASEVASSALSRARSDTCNTERYSSRTNVGTQQVHLAVFIPRQTQYTVALALLFLACTIDVQCSQSPAFYDTRDRAQTGM